MLWFAHTYEFLFPCACSFSWMTAFNNSWIALMLARESSWKPWYSLRDSPGLSVWGLRCRHLTFQSGLKRWVSRWCIVLFFSLVCVLTKLCDSYMFIYIICLAVSTGKHLHKLKAESSPCWWDLACCWRFWVGYWLVCEACCAWWYLLNLRGVHANR
jgi:hypothetical protein